MNNDFWLVIGVIGVPADRPLVSGFRVVPSDSGFLTLDFPVLTTPTESIAYKEPLTVSKLPPIPTLTS